MKRWSRPFLPCKRSFVLGPAVNRRRDSQEANRVTLRCEAVGVADVMLVIIVVSPPVH